MIHSRRLYGLTSISSKGGLLFAGKDTGSGLYNTPKSGFLPRVGFAYAYNDKTVIRGGFGLFQGFLGERRGDVIQPGYTQTTTQPLSTGPNGAPLPFLISNPFPSGITEPSGNSLGRQTALGQTISFFNQDPKVAKQARWSFGVQRELWNGWMFEATYVGDKGYDIEITRNINALPNKYLSLDNSRTATQNANNTNLGGTVANPFFCNNPNATGTGCTSGSALFVGAGATTTRRQLLRPFPNFGDINTTVNDGESWYQSAQFSLDKRFSKDYGVQFAYTMSRWLEATEYLNPADEHPVKQRSPQDTPNRFSMSGFLELPFGRGKRIFGNANRLANAIVGGWQLQGTYVYQTGFPLRFANDLFYLAVTRQFRRVSRPSIAGSIPQRLFHWLGEHRPVARFSRVRPANCATPVDHLRTFPFFLDEVRIDPINNVDLGLRKDIQLRETMKIQLRVEFVNAFNHPLFPGPTVNAGSGGFGAISTSNQLNYARRAQLAAKFIF